MRRKLYEKNGSFKKVKRVKMNKKSEISIVVVDDHEIVLGGVNAMLAATPNIRVIGTALNGHDAIQIVNQLKPDILLIDFNMPDMNGIKTAQKILKKNKKIKVIVFSGIEKTEYIERSRIAGAKGFVIKSLPSNKIINAIESVFYEKEAFVYKGYQIKSPKKPSIINHALFSQLSEKEEDVLELILKGYSISDMARILMRDERSIRNRRENIRKKLGIENDVQLIALAIQAGFYY